MSDRVKPTQAQKMADTVAADCGVDSRFRGMQQRTVFIQADLFDPTSPSCCQIKRKVESVGRRLKDSPNA